MKLRTAIVEDRKPDAERLEQLLKKAFENENISCSCFASGDEFLRAGWRVWENWQASGMDMKDPKEFVQLPVKSAPQRR